MSMTENMKSWGTCMRCGLPIYAGLAHQCPNVPRKIVVPDGMLKAVADDQGRIDDLKDILEAALRWLVKQTPGPAECLSFSDLLYRMRDEPRGEQAIAIVAEWQRRMFLASEPEIPPQIEDLLWSGKKAPDAPELEFYFPATHNEQIIEAFNRGRRLGQ